jgi:hypothetical protein
MKETYEVMLYEDPDTYIHYADTRDNVPRYVEEHAENVEKADLSYLEDNFVTGDISRLLEE